MMMDDNAAGSEEGVSSTSSRGVTPTSDVPNGDTTS